MRKLVLLAFAASFMTPGLAHADASAQGCLSSNDKAAGCTAAIPVPEFDPSTGLAAFALIIGAVVVIRAGKK